MFHTSKSLWRFKDISDSGFNFYHFLLPKITLGELKARVPGIQTVFQKDDGSIVVYSRNKEEGAQVKKQISIFFKELEQRFIETPHYHYSIDDSIRTTLLHNWSFVFQGAVALFLTRNKEKNLLFGQDFEFINSKIGGLYIHPYTILFNDNYIKVIHPVTPENYEKRNIIEKLSVYFIRKMIARVKDAQPGYEGIAAVSMVMDRTGLSSSEIATVINKKASLIRTNPNLALLT